MEFKTFNEKLMAHVSAMTSGEPYLFETDTTKDEMWETYLESFPSGTNEVFRERREFDCNCCKHFIRILGNAVRLKDGAITTIWDFEAGDEKYQGVIDTMAKLIRSKPIRNVFLPMERKVGTQKNLDNTNSDIVWYHFHAVLAKEVKLFKKADIGSEGGKFRDSKNVLKRSLVEFTEESLVTLLDLIAQKSLYKGEEWEQPLREFKKLFDAFWEVEDDIARDLFCWENSLKVGPVISRMRNHSIGVLLQDLSKGMDLNDAVKRYEKIVAPSNYKRPNAIFTKAMVKKAQQTVIDLGFEHSLGRRHAVLDDITVPNVLFANRDAAKVMTGEDPFGELAESVSSKPQKFDKLEEVPADKFIADILPTVQEIEVLLENSHGGNMMSLIAPKDRDAPSMFKWNNGFCWAYAGNITDSMKERVKAMGGNVEGELRFSIQWNDQRDNSDDLDAHCKEPSGGAHIYFGNKGQKHRSSGMLDVDIVEPNRQVPNGPAVENITWTNRRKMPKGVYKLFVHNYSSRGAKSGFTAEVEFDGQVYSFAYPNPLRHNQNVDVAEVTFDGENFVVKEKLSSQMSSRDVWGLTTNNFHPVSVMMYSPNYWDDQKGIGHRHYFFMLKGCMNPECPNGFFNEFLPEELLKHKRVFEALGSKMRVEDTDKQLSGVGFSSTKRASVIVKVKGSFERLVKVVF
jgi:hypothetical protein